jgi:hypothetical protein
MTIRSVRSRQSWQLGCEERVGTEGHINGNRLEFWSALNSYPCIHLPSPPTRNKGLDQVYCLAV